jgi:hypothetical protein
MCGDCRGSYSGQDPVTIGDVYTQDDVCAGSTYDNPHLWDDLPGSCRVCKRRRESASG